MYIFIINIYIYIYYSNLYCNTMIHCLAPGTDRHIDHLQGEPKILYWKSIPSLSITITSDHHHTLKFEL